MHLQDRIIELRRIRPGAIAVNQHNFRTHSLAQSAALRGVLHQVGIADALLAYHSQRNDGALTLIDGHLRRAEAPDEAWPVLILDVNDTEADVLLATLDPLAALAETDTVLLEHLLQQVQTDQPAVQQFFDTLAQQHDIAPTAADMADLTDSSGGGDDFVYDGRIPQRAALGQLWEIDGKHRMVVGDCTDAQTIAHLFDGTPQVDLLVTDPPYGVQYNPIWRHEFDLNTSTGMTREVQNDHQWDWSTVYTLIDTPVMYVWHAAWYTDLVLESIRACDYQLVSLIVWVKEHFAISRGNYHNQHEICWYVVKKGHTHNWQGARDQSTCWFINKLSSNPVVSPEPVWGHGTQKPLECMLRPILNNTAPGQRVCDPFLGTGTTVIAAHRAGRICYGCEIDPVYADVVLARAEAEGLTVRRIESSETREDCA